MSSYNGIHGYMNVSMLRFVSMYISAYRISCHLFDCALAHPSPRNAPFSHLDSSTYFGSSLVHQSSIMTHIHSTVGNICNSCFPTQGLIYTRITPAGGGGVMNEMRSVPIFLRPHISFYILYHPPRELYYE